MRVCIYVKLIIGFTYNEAVRKAKAISGDSHQQPFGNPSLEITLTLKLSKFYHAYHSYQVFSSIQKKKFD